MKIKFDTQELVNALTKVSKAFPQNGTCRLEVKLAEGKYYMNVIAYNEVDLQVQAIAAVEVEGYKDTVLTVCGRKLLEAVNALRVLGSAVELNVRETDIQVMCGDNLISLSLFGEAAKVLAQTEEEPYLRLAVDGDVFKDAISRVAFATLENAAGKSGDGVYLGISGNGQLLTASALCDHLGSTTAIPVVVKAVAGKGEGETLESALSKVVSGVFLPRALVNIAPHFTGRTFVYFFKKMIVVQSGSDGFFIGLKGSSFMKDTFGKVMRAVMGDGNAHLTVKKGAFINALKIAAIGADSGTNKVPVVLKKDGERLMLEDLNCQTKTHVEVEGDEFSEERLFSAKNMLSCVACAGDEVVLSFPYGEMSSVAGISSVGDAKTQMFIVLAQRPKEDVEEVE